MTRRLVLLAMFAMFAVAVSLAWWWPNRPVPVAAPPVAGKLASVSFAPFRAGQSPVTDTFPSTAEVEADAALVATVSRGIRTYAAIEGDYDLPAIARRHGLVMWQGIWLGGDRAQNAREIARGIALANANPDVITRVVVGNEVLLRRDLPVGELVAAIDQVRAGTRTPVTYADVWEFWRQFPEVAAHVDVITLHMLPYWEDVPIAAADAVPHIAAVTAQIRALFPGKPIAIGEAGWPSRGRAREGAVPSRVNEAMFARQFVGFATGAGVDYNLIEAFDQVWKAGGEGAVGANWGLFTPQRARKFGLSGPVAEDPHWPRHAALAVVLAALLLVRPPTRGQADGPRTALVAMALGTALSYAWTRTGPDMNDGYETIAGLANMAAQLLLAVLLVARTRAVLRGTAAPLLRTAAETTRALRLRAAPSMFADLGFVFTWTAALLQVLLVVDPRYRDFPTASFAVPLVAVAVRAALGDLPRGGGGRAEAALAAVLVLGGLASAVQEGPANAQSLVWTAASLVLAVPSLLRLLPTPSSHAQAPSAPPSAPNVALKFTSPATPATTAPTRTASGAPTIAHSPRPSAAAP